MTFPPADAPAHVHQNDACWRIFSDKHWGTIDRASFSVMFFSPQPDDPGESFDSLAEAIGVLGSRGGIVWLNDLSRSGPGINVFEQSGA